MSDPTQEQVKQFMESMGFEETMLGNYSGHGEMIGYDAALLFYQELDKQLQEAEKFNYELGYRTAVTELSNPIKPESKEV